MHRKQERRDLFDIRSGKEFLAALLIGGGVFTIMGTAPWLLAAAIPMAMAMKNSPKNHQKLSYSFWYAKKRGYISVSLQSGKMDISLTEEGRRIASMHLLRMKSRMTDVRKTWDRKWRLILFDVPVENHLKRNAFRHLIKRLGAVKLQQSAWICPHDCSEELAFLQKFFGFSDSQVRMVVAEDVGNDEAFRKHFKL